MPRKIAVSELNASTIDILNTIRANASAEYQSSVPVITSAHDIPAVGEIIYGYPAFANQFISALVNQIALVRIKSATFNNPYNGLKKGYLSLGEVAEEVFVEMAKAREFSAEKAISRELARSLPDVRTAFHAINWRVQYPTTIQDIDLRQAFTREDGVLDLIAKIVDSLYRADEYDSFLLTKYLIIKAVAHGQMYPIALAGSTWADAGTAFRAASNQLLFISDKYNAAGVHTNTNREDQLLFMDANTNAGLDVNLLAAAFHLDKAEFLGNLYLIDDWTTFDNDRFDQIRAECDMLEEVTSTELALMADVKAVLVDREWFQIYDNNIKFTENYLGSGMYWNYWLNIYRTVSSSPFSNAIVFVANGTTVGTPSSIVFTVADISTGANAKVYTLIPTEQASHQIQSFEFVQDETAVEAGIAVHKYGAIIMPTGESAETAYSPKLLVGGVAYSTTGKILTADDTTTDPDTPATKVGDTLTFAKTV